MKCLIHCTYNGQLKTDDPHKWAQTILLYHTTSCQPSGYSPAQLLFGHEIRDGLPTPINHYKPILCAEVEHRLPQVHQHQDPKKHHQELPILDLGQPFFIQHPQSKRWTDQGTIIDFGQNCQEYIVEFKCYVRNRDFLKPDLSAHHQLPTPELSAQTPPTPVVPDTSANLPSQPLVLHQSLGTSVKPICFQDEANTASQNHHLMWAAAPQVFYFSKD